MKLRSVLSVPRVYDVFTRIVLGSSGRAELARRYVRSSAGDRVLDIGCGPGSMIPYLPNTDYVGFDANPAYIASARRRFRDRPRTELHCNMVSAATLDAPASYDVVLACAILHHLDDAEATSLFEIASAALKPGGRLVTFDGAYVDGQSRVAKLILSRDRGEYVRRAEEYVSLAQRVFSDVETHIRHDMLRMPYTHAILECRKR
jgi:SAM-dependent methyltransferase